MTIGNISLPDYPLFLAPMEDITDPSFRMVCKNNGADVLYTEFISSDGLIRDGAKSLKKLDIYDFERPIGIQLYGHLIDAMVEAAYIAEEAGPELIDINFGCPVRKIANRGAGAGMLRNIPLMLEMTEAIVKAVKLPVTVKTRLGWDDESRNIIDIAERLQDTGIKALTIHGRTRAQLYKGEADWTLIGAVKNNPRMTIPIIGNGDIDSPVKAKEMFDRYGVDGIMIGRATVGRPWIFRDIRHYLDTGELLPEPSVNEKADLALLHLDKSLEFKEGKRAIYEMRRHLSNYFKGLPHFKETRLKLLTAIEVDDVKMIINEIRQKWGDFRTEDKTSVYGI
ncbi:MAG: tRNA dihydrouridine synthase DusB [Bacteroidetes bacterium GWE2_41_25]|nr:MAG: tRNA dihydrouridine synthase DusB [Bacteroidetes bacterium GWA2_40_15]OFX91162.1 MAG: tRNA dihydrouridine synthase DusB [Bacteroidetes bacterium GWE2_41_25]OFX96666.1 MAG: tRNA dihydrouridine synthase DusB [Bacteroidetes bacterium GWC2_40_22]OFY60974.1 MAG: tRNA dihydrouridine synthase DusB [Bacteroidetes bacterium GWF2_41_9]HAM09742.1 tRNA dihydrouridine synthase DusB [Bacteroidales bacterium]